MRVSVVITAYQARQDIGAALLSLQRQSHDDWEAVVVDDASTDGTAEEVAARAEGDPRIRLLRQPVNRGPAAGRNAALAACRGDWVALLDADDAFVPDRLAALLAEARTSGADMVADTLLPVSHPGRHPLGPPLPAADWPAAEWIDAESYVAHNDFRPGSYGWGYLKPMIRRDLIIRASLRFREDLTVCEDYHFHLDCLLAGARWRLLPRPLYLYSLRSGSLSRSLSPERIGPILEHSRRHLAEPGLSPGLRRLLARRHRHLLRLAAYVRFRQCLRQRRLAAAAGQALRHPALMSVILAGARRRLLALFQKPE